MSERGGLFVVFDGQDGAGKSTQIKLVRQKLSEQGLDVVTTREPGGSVGAEDVRNLLLSGEAGRWDKMSELFLFTAARRNHVETLIKPALAEGKIVLCDRFVSSTVAYQGYGHGLDLSIIHDVTKIAIGDFKPDLLFLFTVDAEEGLRRASIRRGTETRFESLGQDFYDRVSHGYEVISYRTDIFGKNIVSLDTTQREHESVEDCILRLTTIIVQVINSHVAVLTTNTKTEYNPIVNRVIP